MTAEPPLFLANSRDRVNSQLEYHFSPSRCPGGAPPHTRLHEAMRYSLFNGGKRLRAGLCYAAAEAGGGATADTDRAACALELIHAYSLIHDDLPAMDDDDLRRGQPTCHIAFGEAMAILAGDALQSLAFTLLATPEVVGPDRGLALVRELAAAAGPAGMVAGQAMDMDAVSRQLSLAELETMHRHKTGALIRAAVMMGALSTSGGGEGERAALGAFADALGLAFQVQDDILDVAAETERLGKRQGADLARNKPTYTSLLGLEGAGDKLNQLHRDSIAALAGLGHGARHLRALADFTVQRGF